MSVISMDIANQYGYVSNGKVFLKAYLSFPDREIGEIKESEEASLNYFVNRFGLVEKKVDGLVDAINTSENKGSYMMKLLHMKTYLAEFDGLGDFEPLHKKLDEAEGYLNGLIELNREKNLNTKKELIADLDSIKDSLEWKEASIRVKEIRDRWIKTGAVAKEIEEEYETKFNELINYFYERRRRFFEDREVLFDARLISYKQIIDKLHELNNNLTESNSSTLKPLVDEWKKVGVVPSHKGIDLFTEYKAIKKEINEKSKAFKRRPKADISQWYKCCEYAEALAFDHPATTEFKLKKLQEAWKKLGTPPSIKKVELQERFKQACEKVNEYGHLYASILRRFPNFDDKPEIEKYKIQISQMRYLLGRDQEEYKKIQSESGGFGKIVDKAVLSKLNMLKRRVFMKGVVLKELERELQEIT